MAALYPSVPGEASTAYAGCADEDATPCEARATTPAWAQHDDTQKNQLSVPELTSSTPADFFAGWLLRALPAQTPSSAKSPVEEQQEQHEPGVLEFVLECMGGQAILLVLGLHGINMFGIHIGQLFSESAFVYSPDSHDADPSRTVRFVRVLDIVASLLFGVWLMSLGVILFHIN